MVLSCPVYLLVETKISYLNNLCSSCSRVNFSLDRGGGSNISRQLVDIMYNIELLTVRDTNIDRQFLYEEGRSSTKGRVDINGIVT